MKNKIVNTYDYILSRVEYPQENGYRMEPERLPPWIKITVTTNCEDGNKYLTVLSEIHVDKSVKVGPIYSLEFSDSEIIKDLSGEICRRFL